MEQKPVTLHDVAKAAGVSFQTVSRVINQHPHVAKETRERVIYFVEKLGYHPNRAARNLVTNRFNTIGIVSFGAMHYGPAQMMINIERSLRKRGYTLTSTSIEDLSLEALDTAVRELLQHQVDGLVLITPIHSVEYEHISSLTRGVPFVLVDIELGKDLPSVVIDQQHGAHLAAQHLLSLGHRYIAEIHGPLDWVDARSRHTSFLRTLRESGVEPVVSVGGDWSVGSGYAAMHLILHAHRQPTAVFVHNDQMALGAMRAIREKHLRIPTDISLVGVDNIPESAFFEPPLTTVHQDFASLGNQSVDYLVHLMREPTLAVHQRVLKPKLIKRESTAKVDPT